MKRSATLMGSRIKIVKLAILPKAVFLCNPYQIFPVRKAKINKTTNSSYLQEYEAREILIHH